VGEVQRYGADSPHAMDAVDIAFRGQVYQKLPYVLAQREGHEHSLQPTCEKHSSVLVTAVKLRADRHGMKAGQHNARYPRQRTRRFARIQTPLVNIRLPVVNPGQAHVFPRS
jgi:hypothetical protein